MNSRTPEEIFDIFRSRMGGRASAFTTHFITPSGREGYRRVCSAGNRCLGESFPDCGRCRGAGPLPMSPEIVTAHLAGAFPVGIYPADEKGRCKFSLIELTGEDFRPRMQLLAAVCRGAGLTHICELTDFGRKGRLWIFYPEPITPRMAAETAAEVLSEGEIAMGELPGEYSAGIFPLVTGRSDFGRPVMLPLFDAESGFSVFTDDELRPVPDALELMAGPVSKGGPVSLPAGKGDFPPIVRVELCDKLYVSAAGFTPRGLAALCDLARIPNPELSSESGGAKSVFVRCTGFSNGRVHLPRGIGEELRSLLKPYSKVVFSDGRRPGSEVYLRPAEESSYQLKKAVNRLLSHDCGVITAPVGSGKTQLIFGAMAALRRSTLILVTERAAAVRWHKRLARHFGLSEERISCVTDDNSYPNGILDVALLGARTELWLAEHLPHYGLVIAADVDRLHCGGEVFRSVMESVCAQKIYAVTSRPLEITRYGDYVRLFCGKEISIF